jgi:hypothetical protein
MLQAVTLAAMSPAQPLVSQDGRAVDVQSRQERKSWVQAANRREQMQINCLSNMPLTAARIHQPCTQAMYRQLPPAIPQRCRHPVPSVWPGNLQAATVPAFRWNARHGLSSVDQFVRHGTRRACSFMDVKPRSSSKTTRFYWVALRHELLAVSKMIHDHLKPGPSFLHGFGHG